MASYNNLITEEFVKEIRTSGTVTSLTIKLVAYDGDNNMTTVTGDGSTYLEHDDQTWREKSVNSRTYYDWDNCTALTSKSFTYTVPADEQTNLVQTGVSDTLNSTNELAYQEKRKAWIESYQASATYITKWEELYAAVEAL